MPALDCHAQRLLPRQVTFPKLPLAVLIPAGDCFPRRPQHRIRDTVSRKRDRYTTIQQPADRDAVTAELVEAVAIARHPEKTRDDRCDHAERLHATDLRV